MNIKKRNLELKNTVLGLVLLCLIPACSESNESPQPIAKGSNPMQTNQVGQVVDVTQEAGKTEVTGEAQAVGITALKLELSNGEVECVVGDAKPGEITLSWTIRPQKSEFFKGGDPKDLEVTVVQNGDQLVVEDHWRGKNTGNRPNINMIVTAHPDTLVNFSLGNGNLTLENSKIAGLSLGNGQVIANGELISNAGISLGNGELKGNLLIAEGQHSISVGNGAVNLKATEGSSFKLDTAVGIGQVSVIGVASERQWGFLGGSVSAVVGDGTGTLDIATGNGLIEVEVPAKSR